MPLPYIQQLLNFEPYWSRYTKSNRIPKARVDTTWLVTPYHPLWYSAGLNFILKEMSMDSRIEERFGKQIQMRLSWKNANPPLWLRIRRADSKKMVGDKGMDGGPTYLHGI